MTTEEMYRYDGGEDIEDRFVRKSGVNRALVIGLAGGGVVLLLLLCLCGVGGVAWIAWFPGGTQPDEFVGSWKGRFFLRGQTLDIVYTFDKSGQYYEQEFDLQGQCVRTWEGRWRFRDGRLEINFGLFDGFEKAAVDFVDDDTMNYRIVDHTERAQIGLQTTFHRE